MKKLLFLYCCWHPLYSGPRIFRAETIRLEAKEDYKVADPELNKALDYLLGTPLNMISINRAQCWVFKAMDDRHAGLYVLRLPGTRR